MIPHIVHWPIDHVARLMASHLPLVLVPVLASLVALAWVIVYRRRGTVVLRVQRDPDAKDEKVSVLISRSSRTPLIRSIAAYRKKLDRRGNRKRRFEAWNVGQNTAFHGIPPGRWYVHLYGVHARAGHTTILRIPPKEVEVVPRKASFVACALEAPAGDFKIVVLRDGQAVDGARVWVDDEFAKSAISAKDGSVSMKIAEGYRVIHVMAQGLSVERPHHVGPMRHRELTIDLASEQRTPPVVEGQQGSTALPERRSPPVGIEIHLEDTPVVEPKPHGQRGPNSFS